jgi:hypothetical protein
MPLHTFSGIQAQFSELTETWQPLTRSSATSAVGEPWTSCRVENAACIFATAAGMCVPKLSSHHTQTTTLSNCCVDALRTCGHARAVTQMTRSPGHPVGGSTRAGWVRVGKKRCSACRQAALERQQNGGKRY